MEKSDSPKSIRVFCAFPTVTLLLAKTEVALNRERRLLDLGLLLDLRLVLDLRFALNTLRTLRLALDPLRTRRSRACLFARRAVAFNPPVGAGVAVRAVLFQLTVRAGVALSAVVLPLAVRARDALHAAAFQLAVRAGLALSAVVFHVAVRTRLALRAPVFHVAVRARFTLLAVAFLPSVRTSFLSYRSRATTSHAHALMRPRNVVVVVVALFRTFQEISAFRFFVDTWPPHKSSPPRAIASLSDALINASPLGVRCPPPKKPALASSRSRARSRSTARTSRARAARPWRFGKRNSSLGAAV